MNLLDMSFDPTTLVLGTVFGAIGFVAYRYGRKMELVPPVAIGLALMVYPMFVAGRAWTVAIGLSLTAALYLFRE